MTIQDAFRALVTTDLYDTPEEHELDVMAAMLRHDLIRVDATLVPRFNQLLDLLGRFAPEAPVHIGLLIKTVLPEIATYTEELGQTVLNLIDLLGAQEVLRDDEHDPNLVIIPPHVAAWARGYSVRMRREEQPGLRDEAAVGPALVTAISHVLVFALGQNDRALLDGSLPHGRFWLGEFGADVGVELLPPLRELVDQAERRRSYGVKNL